MTIEHLRQLHHQATPSPWKAVDNQGWLVAGPPFTDGSMRDEQVCDLDYSERGEHQENAELIAAARNALPHLLDIAEAANNLNLNHPDGDWGINKLHQALAQLEETT